MKLLSSLFFFFLLVATNSAFSQIYVQSSASGNNDGSSWTDAFQHLQDALAAAEAGEEIWVAAGVYYPDEGLNEYDNNTNSTFRIKRGVSLFGGFSGHENSIEERDWQQNLTVLSGDINKNDMDPDDDGVISSYLDLMEGNATSVLQISYVEDLVTLDGFTVTAGHAKRSPFNNGAGFYIVNSSVEVKNCTFIGNYASGRGGAVFNFLCSPTYSNCSFINNYGLEGGGMFNMEAPTHLVNCSFTDNRASTGGGVFDRAQPSVTEVSILENCLFKNNSSSSRGGGMSFYQSSAKIFECVFDGNKASSSGGGMYIYSSKPTVKNTTFINNKQTGRDIGGGVIDANDSHPVFINCLLANNWSRSGLGTGIYNTNSSSTFINTTFSGNTTYADLSNELIYNIANRSTNTALINCIIWGNAPGSTIFNGNTNSTATISYSLIEGAGGSENWSLAGVRDGGGNIDENPQFSNSGNGNFSLLSSSPAIDAGAVSHVPEGINTDLAGNQRIRGKSVDMGALESPAIEVSNQAPTAIALSSTVVEENKAVGTVVGTFSTTDPDASDEHRYSLKSTGDEAFFTIDGDALKTSRSFDFEQASSYEITVISTDKGEGTYERTLMIKISNLNDTKPKILSAQSFGVEENSAAGISLGTVLANDPDGVTTYEAWTISGGNRGGAFAVDPATGEITVADASAIDYEVNRSFTLEVEVSDGINISETATVEVRLNNLNDTQPVVTADQIFWIDENSAITTVVGSLEVTDADGPTTYSNWAILSGNTGNAFAVDEITGVIRVADDAGIDFELNSSYILEVAVSDGENTSEKVEVVVNLNNLNDVSPLIPAGQVFSVEENSPEGTELGTVSVRDPDGTSIFSNWIILSGNHEDALSLDPVAGVLRVQTQEALDFEEKSSFNLLISVSDGANVTEQTVSVTVKDVSEHQPTDILLSHTTFKESVMIGTEVGRFSTVDLDEEEVHTYSLVTGEGDAQNSKFRVAAGSLITAGEFDYDYESSVSIRVRSTDSGGEYVEKVFLLQPQQDTDLDLAIPTAFSPNGDGVNETWEIDRLKSYPASILKVFNSDGREVFSNTGYTRQWDGTFYGKKMAFGSYYYILQLDGSNDKVYRGTVMILK